MRRTQRSRLTKRHPCGHFTLPGMPCPNHPEGHPKAVSPQPENPAYPIVLGAPAQPAEDYDPAKRLSLENQVRNLRSKIAARDLDDLNKFDAGVTHGRESERREIAERLERNANALTGNGTTKDPIVRTVLRALAQQLRALGVGEERTG